LSEGGRGSLRAFRTRVERSRVGRGAERWLLRVVGRPLRCAECGRVLFVGLPLVWRGRVRIVGARESHVRVSFTAKDTLELRHVELDQCPSPDRPWVA
jgi:hypothetical protein